ncbi:MAG TPA: EAL domain-containing protein [Steroidobacteraceae bacterium]|nr:EAL domain-containing protein [Steroidobacteraceae bacterium]
MLPGRAHRWPLVALTILALTLLLRAAGFLAPFEHRAADARSQLLQRQVASDIVLVGIDARSLADLRQWPWPRRYHARLLETIAAAGPRRVFVDVDFSAHTNAEDDGLLESSLAGFEPSRIVLPAFFQPDPVVAGRFVYTTPLERLRGHVTLGGVNFRPDDDGLIRWMAAKWSFGDHSVPSAVALLAGPEGAAQDEVPIDYSISPASFMYLSYVDVLAGRVDPAALRDKTVLVGPTALELTDIKAVPVYQSLPGVLVQALAAQTVREGVLRTTPWWLDFCALAILTALAAASFGRHRWRRNLLAGAITIAVLGALNVYAYSAQRLVLEFVPALLIVGGMFLAATIRSLDQETMRALVYAFGMRRRDALLGSVAESSADAIMVVGRQGQIEMANAAAASMFACSRESMVGAMVSRYVPLPDATHVPLTLPGKVIEAEATKHNGTPFPVEITVSPVDIQGEALRTVIVRDITARKLQEQRLQYEATHDSLTDLPNRAALMSHLEVTLTRARSDGRVALLMLDLCRFKEVNDTLGHEIGDQVLREVARRFESVSGHGFVARLGGDEFTLVLEHTASDDDTVAVAGILHESLRVPIAAAGIAIDVGVSIGIARYPEDALDPATLLRHADVAMYVAKRRQTRFEMYDPANDRNTVRRLAMVGELRNAIANGQLRLYYQPKIDFRNGRCDSVEALIRWPHPEYGFVSPAEFIVLAESTDLIRPLTEWTLACAMTQWLQWRACGLQVRIAVNLSARLLQDTDFTAVLRALLEKHRVPGEALELEITESAMLYDSERALRVIREIHALGTALSIDDFGTGFSSLAYLRLLPVHAVKLDKSFVTNLHERADDRSIVNSTVRMAHELGLKVVAEGVESEWTAQYLAQAGYDFGQGYRYSPAIPADECRRWIVNFNSAAAAGDAYSSAAGPLAASG